MGLFAGNAARSVEDVLEEIGIQGPIAVVGDEKLTRRLAELRRPVVDSGDDSPVEVVVISDLSRDPEWGSALAAAQGRLVADGWIVLVDRGQRSEVSRRALCGGISDVSQRTTGRWLITYGRVRSLAALPSSSSSE